MMVWTGALLRCEVVDVTDDELDESGRVEREDPSDRDGRDVA